MKQISAWPNYPGYIKDVKGYSVQLDGVEIKNVIAADEEMGTVVLLCLDAKGNVTHNDDIVETEVRHGVVKIIAPEAANAVS